MTDASTRPPGPGHSTRPHAAALLLLGLLCLADSARAVAIQSLSLVKHSRFYVGGDKQFIGDPYNWSGVARTVAELAPDGVTQWGGRWGTMISPSYFISANHWHPYPGSTLRFYHGNDPNGPYEDRVVLSGAKVGAADLWLGQLSAPVSSAVAKYPILRLSANSSYTSKPLTVVGRPTDDNVGTPVKMHMGLNRISTTPSGGTYAWGNLPDAPDKAKAAEGGDSGGPTFILSNGVPTVLGIHWFTNGGSFVPDHVSELNAAMSGGEQITVQTTYVAPPPVVPPTPPAPASERWNVDLAGSWADHTKWLSGAHYPYVAGNIATFDYNLTARRNITLIAPDPPITVGGIVFNDTDVTGQNGLSSSGYAVVLDGNNLTLDNGTAGYHAEDLVVIEMPASNKTGHQFANTTGKLVMTDNVQFNLNSGGGVELNLGSGLLSGTRGLTKTGNSQLLVAGDNSTYSGNIRVAEGLLQARGSNKAFGTGTVTLTNGPADNRSASLGFNNYGTVPTFANAFIWEQTSGVTGSFTPFNVINTDVVWAGTISSVNPAAGDGASLGANALLTPYGRTGLMVTLSGNNSGLKFASGKGFVTSIYLGVGGATALGTANSAYVQIGSGSYAQAGILATVAVPITSKIDVTHAGNVASAVIGGLHTSGTASFGGSITLNSNSSANLRQTLFRSDTGGTVVFTPAAVIGNGTSNGSYAPVTKIGGGRMEFNAANTYLGTTAVRSGELVLGHANALGAAANTTAVNLGDATTVLPAVRVATKGNEGYGTYISGTITGAATSIDGITLAADDRVLVKDQTTAWKNGIYVVQSTTSTWVRDPAMDSLGEETRGVQVAVTAGTTNAGKVFFLTQSATAFESSGLDWQPDLANPSVSVLSNGVTISRGINVVANGSSGLSTLGGVNTAGTATFSGAVALARGLTVTAATGGTVEFSGNISGGSGVTKTGAGKVILTNSKSYTGPTSVTQGVLAVNGTLATSGVTVNTGAVLQGGGTLANGMVTGGRLAPGNSIGTLTAGSASFNASGVLEIEVSGTAAGTADRLNVTNNLNLTNATLDLNILATPDDSAYVIASYGTLTGKFAAVLDLPAGYQVLYNYNSLKQIAIVRDALVDYSTWTGGFGTGFTDTHPSSDPDGDGLDNRREYAFGLDPTRGTSANPVILPLRKDTGSFVYSRRKTSLSALVYSVLTSSNLRDWALDNGAVQAVTGTSGDVETVHVTVNPGLLEATRLFVRMAAE